ncbi:MAG: hypothetical protein P8J26_10575, partial [Pseudomonadales bacterium]|nr:hypothetical protein [Pseudomonadales bacterium]
SDMGWACNKYSWLHTYLAIEGNALQTLSSPTVLQRGYYLLTAYISGGKTRCYEAPFMLRGYRLNTVKK